MNSAEAITVEIRGRAARLLTLLKARDASGPSIILLHGATGAGGLDRLEILFGAALAEEKVAVYLLHYFEATGTNYANDAVIAAQATVWSEVVAAAVGAVRVRRPEAPVILAGYSLGGFLAAAAMTRGEPVDAIIVIAGGLDAASAASATQGGPALICHGSADRRVPLAEAERLANTLRRLGAEPEFHIYPNEGHHFSPPWWMQIAKLCFEFVLRFRKP